MKTCRNCKLLAFESKKKLSSPTAAVCIEQRMADLVGEKRLVRLTEAYRAITIAGARQKEN